MSGHGHGAVDGDNKKIALLISVLALFLAISETLGKSAQTSALGYNIEASNLWAFFQAKTIRMTVVRTAAEQAELDRASVAPDAPGLDASKKRVEAWNKTAARWDSEPETGEGRKELAARAKVAEEKSTLNLARYHHYEFGSAAFQIAIVLASAMLITGVAAIGWAGVGLGIVGIGFVGLGMFAPHVHLF